MNQLKTSGIFALFWFLFIVSGINYFYTDTDNSLQKHKAKIFKGKNNFQSSRAQQITSKLSADTSRSPGIQPLRITENKTRKAVDNSALPNEFTIPFELLYLDDQPIEVEPIVENNQSRQQYEYEPPLPKGMDALLPNADTIPPELRELDEPPN